MKHSELPHVDILEFGPPREVALMLRRQFPVMVRRRLLFEVREWEGKPWVAVYMMEDTEYANLVESELDFKKWLDKPYYEMPHPRSHLGRQTSKLLDVYSCELVDLPRRYKNQIVTRATVDPVLKGWVLIRM